MEYQLCKDNHSTTLSREMEIQTNGQLNTTLAYMCPGLPAGPSDDMAEDVGIFYSGIW